MAVQYPREYKTKLQICEPYKTLARKILGVITKDEYDLIRSMTIGDLVAILGLTMLQQENQDCSLDTLDETKVSELLFFVNSRNTIHALLSRLRKRKIIDYEHNTQNFHNAINPYDAHNGGRETSRQNKTKNSRDKINILLAI